MLRRLIGDDIDFAARLDLEAGRVRVDPARLDQLVMNLTDAAYSRKSRADRPSRRARRRPGWNSCSLSAASRMVEPKIVELNAAIAETGKMRSLPEKTVLARRPRQAATGYAGCAVTIPQIQPHLLQNNI